jgi:hypothetical protein
MTASSLEQELACSTGSCGAMADEVMELLDKYPLLSFPVPFARLSSGAAFFSAPTCTGLTFRSSQPKFVRR